MGKILLRVIDDLIGSLIIKELLAILTRVSVIFPATNQVALRNIALAKDVTN